MSNSRQQWFGWHFLNSNRKTRYLNPKLVQPGRVLCATGSLSMCYNGMHASRKVIQAIKYAPGPVLCRVQLMGQRIDGDDKACASKRKCLWMGDASSLMLSKSQELVVSWLNSGMSKLIQNPDAALLIKRYLQAFRKASAGEGKADTVDKLGDKIHNDYWPDFEQEVGLVRALQPHSGSLGDESHNIFQRSVSNYKVLLCEVVSAQVGTGTGTSATTTSGGATVAQIVDFMLDRQVENDFVQAFSDKFAPAAEKAKLRYELAA